MHTFINDILYNESQGSKGKEEKLNDHVPMAMDTHEEVLLIADSVWENRHPEVVLMRDPTGMIFGNLATVIKEPLECS